MLARYVNGQQINCCMLLHTTDYEPRLKRVTTYTSMLVHYYGKRPIFWRLQALVAALVHNTYWSIIRYRVESLPFLPGTLCTPLLIRLRLLIYFQTI